MAKASKKTIEDLHGKLAEYYLDVLEDDMELSSGTLNAINAFLKQNNVVAEEIEESPFMNIHNRLQSLIEQENGE